MKNNNSQNNNGNKQTSRKLIPVKGLSRGQKAQVGNIIKEAINSEMQGSSPNYSVYNPREAPVMSPLMEQALKMVHPQAANAVKVAAVANNIIRRSKIAQDTIEKAQKAFKGVPDLPSGGNTVMDSNYGLSKAPNPKPVRMNSGIAPNAYANDFMIPRLNQCSPMHVTALSLQIPTVSTSVQNIYFKSTVAFDIQTRAQANVNFSLDIISILTQDNILTAFNAAISALQVYYYYTSILSYESNTKNKNSAMINLRNGITSQMLSDLVQLGRRLEDTPIPPRVVEWVRYMNMNFLSGDSQGAPLLKIGFDSTCFDTFPSPSFAASALANLVSGNNTNVFTLIRRAIPQWRVGTLYDVPTVPVYDKNFLTIFANAPAKWYDGAAYRYNNNVASTITAAGYNSYSNKLDGAAYAMSSFYITQPNYEPGFVIPNATTTTQSRRSFYTDGTTSAWYNSIGTPFLVQSRQETATVNLVADAILFPHLFGTERVNGVTINSLNQTGQNFQDFLFSVNSIPTRGKLASFNQNGKGNKI